MTRHLPVEEQLKIVHCSLYDEGLDRSKQDQGLIPGTF